MANDAPNPSGPRRGAAIVAAVLGVLTLSFGVPRLMAALTALEARQTVWEVYAGAPPSYDALLAAAKRMEHAIQRVPDGEAETDLGLLLLRAGETLPVGGERDRLMGEAEARTAAGLARAPGQPAAWARLAELRARRGDVGGAVAALRLSWLAGAFVPALMTERVTLGVRLLPALDPESLALLRRQIRLSWVVAPDFVAGLGARPGVEALVRDALSTLSDQEMTSYLRLYGAQP